MSFGGEPRPCPDCEARPIMFGVTVHAHSIGLATLMTVTSHANSTCTPSRSVIARLDRAIHPGRKI
jgi:hypothetical protein